MADTVETPYGPYTDSGVGLSALAKAFKNWQAGRIADTEAALSGRRRFLDMTKDFTADDVGAAAPVAQVRRDQPPAPAPRTPIAAIEGKLSRGNPALEKHLAELNTKLDAEDRVKASLLAGLAEGAPVGTSEEAAKKFLAEQAARTAPTRTGWDAAYAIMRGKPLYRPGKGVNFEGMLDSLRAERADDRTQFEKSKAQDLANFLMTNKARSEDAVVNEARRTAQNTAALANAGVTGTSLQRQREALDYLTKLGMENRKIDVEASKVAAMREGNTARAQARGGRPMAPNAQIIELVNARTQEIMKERAVNKSTAVTPAQARQIAIAEVKQLYPGWQTSVEDNRETAYNTAFE